MDLLIEKMNKLQDLCMATSIKNTLDLPQIVVLGSQSSGKSSVLENIVGRDFLPRGTGIVTRRPLIIQLIYSKNLENEYCEFSHTNKVFLDFEQVKKEIVAETERAVKNKYDVSENAILLRLFSPNVLSLTLVDLPGLVKIPTANQPKDISLRIETICRKYVENKNAIILAVSAANIDISNSDALLLAKQVDPRLERTVGVLTKLDLMDKDTDAVDVLAGKAVSLRLGFVPVVSRSQTAINSGVTISSALETEKTFFANHKSYKKNKLFCGTPFLVQKLNLILHEHIKMCLPSLQQQIDRQLSDFRAELSAIGTVELSPREFIFKTISEVSKRFNDVLHGRAEISSTELSGGARLSYTFHHHFAEFMGRLEALDGVSDEQVRTLLYNSGGSSSTLLFAHVAFEKLARQSVSQLKSHAIKLVAIVFNELVKMLHGVVSDLRVSRFSTLSEKVITSSISLFKKHCDSATKLVASFVDWNIEYINTKNPDFLTGKDEISSEGIKKENIAEKINKITFDPIPNTLKIGRISESEKAEVILVKNLVKRYFEVIKKIVIDQVPKAVMADLVIVSERELQEVLFREVYEAEGLIETITESDDTKERRKVVDGMIKALLQANDLLCSI